MKTRLPSVSNSPCLKRLSVCVCVVLSCVRKDPKVNLEIASPKRKRKEYLSIFSVFCHRLNFFPPVEALFLPDCVHLLIDNWLQSHSGLLKYQAGASGFRPRPQAPPLSASGRLAPLEPIPVSPIQPGCFVYLHLCRLPATHRVRLGGADRVSALTG